MEKRLDMDWTCEVVARMHKLKMQNKELAQLTGYAPGYISMLLNGHRDTENAREKIMLALDRAESDKKGEQCDKYSDF